VIRIAVDDRGPGVPPAILPRIFDRFFTTDADRDGTGLGLAIVQSVVQAHGGTIRADSAPGEGATFVVELPAPAGRWRAAGAG
jgi:two-component system sensor histidine kinase ChvG